VPLSKIDNVTFTSHMEQFGDWTGDRFRYCRRMGGTPVARSPSGRT
jgi:hypothetical protein